MKKWTHISFWIGLLLFLGCSPKDCYEVNVQFEKRANVEKNCPLVTDGGIVAFVTEVDKGNGDLSTAKICVPNDVKIPKDSKIFAGYVKEFSAPCIKIDFGTLNEFDDGEHPLASVYRDTIKLALPDADTTLGKKIIDIVRDYNQQKKKK